MPTDDELRAIGKARMDAARAAALGPVAAKERAIRVADANADVAWKRDAYGAVLACAATLPEFTADDVWEEIGRLGDTTTHEPSALGPVFLRASRAGKIVKTGRQVLSRNTRRHRDLTVWRSGP